MNTVNSACDPAKLQQAISESLDPQSEQQLAEHLSGCESCRNLLDQFAGEAAFWSRATERLAETSNVETTSGDEFHSSVFVRVDQNSPAPATLEVGPSDELRTTHNCRSTLPLIRKCWDESTGSVSVSYTHLTLPTTPYV